MGKEATYSQRQPNCTYQVNEREDATTSYK